MILNRIAIMAIMAVVSIGAYAISENVKIQGDHGRLDAIIQTPMLEHGQKVPMAIICHGFTGNKKENLLKNIADSLEKRGIASIRFDFNGHGNSEGRFVDMTVPNEISDAEKVLDYVNTLSYVSNIFMIGHSQGGVVTAMTAGKIGVEKISAIVLLAPAAILREDALRGTTMGAKFDPYNPGDSIAIFGGKKYLGGNYIRTAINLPIYETAARYEGPACIIHGNHDNIVPYTFGERFKTTIKNSEFHLLDGLDHGFSKHENEVAHLVAVYLNAKIKTTKKTKKLKDFLSSKKDANYDKDKIIGEDLGGGYSRDDKHAYYNGKRISTAQGGRNFTYKGGGYATDGINTYFKGKLVDRN